MGIELRLTNSRISFAEGLWRKSTAVEGGIPKHNVDFIVSPDTLIERKTTEGKWVKTTLAEAQELERIAAFKGDKAKANAWFEDLDSRQKSVRVGNKNKDRSGEVRDGYADMLYVHATAAKQSEFNIYNANAERVADRSKDPIYSGCYVIARIQLYCNLKRERAGLFCGLQGVQFYKDGDAFGGGRAASEDDFAPQPAASGSNASDFG